MGILDNILGRRDDEERGKREGRLPPGQSLTNKFPVLTYGPNAKFNATAWDFRLFGSVDGEPMIRPKEGVIHEGEVGVTDSAAYQLWSDIYNHPEAAGRGQTDFYNRLIAQAPEALRSAIETANGTIRFGSLEKALTAIAALIEAPAQKMGVLNSDPMRWTWDQFLSLPTVTITCDIHCVTRWSKFDTTWVGVRLRDFLETYFEVSPKVKYVIAHCDLGYTTNLPFETMLEDDVLLTYKYAGQPLEPDHGAPLRTLVPKRYFWKSAKFLRALEFSPIDKPGFWEQGGYHNEGDPFKEERYSSRRGYF